MSKSASTFLFKMKRIINSNVIVFIVYLAISIQLINVRALSTKGKYLKATIVEMFCALSNDETFRSEMQLRKTQLITKKRE